MTVKVFTSLVLLGAWLFIGAMPAHCQTQAGRAQVWISPCGNGFQELLDNPDGWRSTRPLVDVMFTTDLHLGDHKAGYTDAVMRADFAKMNAWNLKFGMEVGAVKEWGVTGARTFAAEKPIWDRIVRNGGKIYAIAMDEPLICVRHSLKKSDEYAVQETASYIALVRQNFPNTLVGDIETYPSMTVEDNVRWIDALNKKLDEMNVRKLDFYRLDVDWVGFEIAANGSWKGVKQIEDACRSRHLPFSLIYWESDFWALKNRGLAGDYSWYTGVVQQAIDYAIVGGSPDQFVIESWIPAPDKFLPDDASSTFTRSVHDIALRFAKKGQ